MAEFLSLSYSLINEPIHYTRWRDTGHRRGGKREEEVGERVLIATRIS